MTSPGRTGHRLLLALAAACALCACGERGGEGETADTEPEGAPAPPADPYPYEPVNLDVWLERLEVGSRELYSARESVADALEIGEGERIADVGAGTGLYTLIFAEKTGPTGVVYAVDIAPRFLTLINQRADDLGLDNVVSVLNRPDSITLPPQSVDSVFISDTYHYFDEPEAMMRTVFEALRPGGELYIVDYDLAPGAVPPADKRHVRFGKAETIAELQSFGFTDVEELDVPGLEDNYMLRLRRP